MEKNCDICNKTFSSKQSLNIHKKTVKSCNNGNSEKITYDCKYCNKKISSPNGLKYHLEICLIKKDKEIEELTKLLDRRTAHFKNMEVEYKEELASNKISVIRLETVIDQLEQTNEKAIMQIQDLQDKLERLVKNALDKKTVTNNTTNNTVEVKYIFPTQEKIDQIIKEKFTEKHLICGPKGVAKFIVEEIIRTDDGEMLYKCFDVSRQIYIFYNDLGEEVKDVKGYKLIEMIHPGIMKKSVELKTESENEYQKLKAKGCDRTPEETDRMCFLKSANDIFIPKCITDIRLMKSTNKLSCELSRLTS